MAPLVITDIIQGPLFSFAINWGSLLFSPRLVQSIFPPPAIGLTRVFETNTGQFLSVVSGVLAIPGEKKKTETSGDSCKHTMSRDCLLSGHELLFTIANCIFFRTLHC